MSYANQVEHAAQELFGADSPTTYAITNATSSLRRDLERINQGQGSSLISIAIVGKVGEGKSWLTQTFINHLTPELQSEIPSGQNASDRSEYITWLSEAPLSIELTSQERFVKLPTNSLLDLGAPYCISDTPGYSDNDASFQTISSQAAYAANVKILATSMTNIRDQSLTKFIHSLDGSIILPVVRYRPESSGAESVTPSHDVVQDCNSEMQGWHQAAPLAHVLPPIFVPDAGIAGQEVARHVSRQLLSKSLSELLKDPRNLTAHLDKQLENRMNRARQEIKQTLQNITPMIEEPVQRLATLQADLPELLSNHLLGGEDQLSQLKVALRSKFRADALERTPAIFFPFKSLLGIIGFTQGAWDRLIFTSLGSVPSLVITAFHSIKAWNKSKNYQENLRDQSHQRLHQFINDAYRKDIRLFKHALANATNEAKPATDHVNPIEIHGLVGLEGKCQQIIANSIKSHSVSRITLWIAALAAFLIFWAMMLGPGILLYTDYLKALEETASNLRNVDHHYPIAHGSQLFTSALLALIPCAIIAMLTTVIITYSGRVKKATKRIQKDLLGTIHQGVKDKSINIQIQDKKVSAAKQLLSL